MRRNEKPQDYFYDKLKMLNQLNASETEKVGYIIRGIENDILRIQLKAANPATTEELLKLMKTLSDELEMGYRERKKTPDQANKFNSSMIKKNNR